MEGKITAALVVMLAALSDTTMAASPFQTAVPRPVSVKQCSPFANEPDVERSPRPIPVYCQTWDDQNPMPTGEPRGNPSMGGFQNGARLMPDALGDDLNARARLTWSSRGVRAPAFRQRP